MIEVETENGSTKGAGTALWVGGGGWWHSGWCRKKSGISVDGCGSRDIPDQGAHEGSGGGALGKGRPGVLQPRTVSPGGGVELSQ